MAKSKKTKPAVDKAAPAGDTQSDTSPQSGEPMELTGDKWDATPEADEAFIRALNGENLPSPTSVSPVSEEEARTLLTQWIQQQRDAGNVDAANAAQAVLDDPAKFQEFMPQLLDELSA